MKLLRSSLISILTMFLLVIVTLFLFGIGNGLQFPTVIGAALVAVVVLPVVFVVWGLPVYFVLKKLKLDTPILFSFLGALPGALFISLIHPFGEDGLPALIGQSLFFSFIGASGAISLWYQMVYKTT